MENFYVVLTQTGTLISKGIRLFTKKPYNHASLSFNRDLSTMYSFGRRIMWFPFYGGFVTEKIESGVYARFPNTKCQVYEFEVEKEQLDLIRSRLDAILSEGKKYKYALEIGIFYFINMPATRKYRYTCSGFVAYLLQDIYKFKKHFSLIRPDEIPSLGGKLIYSGLLREYKEPKGCTGIDKGDIII